MKELGNRLLENIRAQHDNSYKTFAGYVPTNLVLNQALLRESEEIQYQISGSNKKLLGKHYKKGKL